MMSFQIEIDTAIKEKRLYFVGEALPADWYAAFRTWLPLAEAGDPKAQYNIGRCYNRGDGVDQDSTKAKFWYEKAALQNDPRAHFNLALFFSDEKSSERDPERAETFLQKAAELGEPRALTRLAEREQKQIEEEAKHQRAELLRLRKENEEFFLKIQRDNEEKFLNLLGSGDKKSALNFLHGITDERISWLKDYIKFFDVQVKLRRTQEHVSVKSCDTYAGGMVNGTTQYFKYTTRAHTHYAFFAIDNRSDSDLAIRIGSDSFLVQAKQSQDVVTKFNNSRENITIAGFVPDLNEEIRVRIDSEPFVFRRKLPVFLFKNPVLILGYTEETKSRSAGCFVLTACYGNEDHPVVIDFRNFRDDFLLRSDIGNRLVDFYYKHSPRIAKSIETMPVIKMLLRGLFRVVRLCLPRVRSRAPQNRRSGPRG